MGGVVGGRAKMAWTTRQYLCTASAAREKEKERNQRLGKRGTDGQNSVSGSSDNLSSTTLLHRGQREEGRELNIFHEGFP